MALFNKMFGKQQSSQPEHAISIYLNTVDLDESIYRSCGTFALDGLLTKALGAQGIVEGTETRSTETVLFLYGKDSEKMFSLIYPVLNSYPLCKGAKVILRAGPTGSPERTITV